MNMAMVPAPKAVPAKLGSEIKQDYAPGAYVTDDTLKAMMMEQGRPMIGGSRDYGREYDDYYQDRRWGYSAKGLTLGDVRKAVAEDVATYIATGRNGMGRWKPGSLLRKAARRVKGARPRKVVKKRVVAPAKGKDWGAFWAKHKASIPTKRVVAPAKAAVPPVLTKSQRIDWAALTAGPKGAVAMPDWVSSRMGKWSTAGLSEGNTAYLMPEDLAISGLGAELPPPESVDILTAVREIYGIALDVKPLAEFVGAHPITSVAAFMMVVGAWAGLAAYVGAGGVEVIKELMKKG